MSKTFAVAAFDRRGHGRTSDSVEPFSVESMAEETIAFIELLKRRVHLIGHSDGGNVALLVALKRPDLVRRIVVVGSNFHHDGLMAMEDFTPCSPGFADFALSYAKHSPDGIEHARIVVEKTLHLIKTGPSLTKDDLGHLVVPVLVMAGDDDVAKLEHTKTMYESIPNAQLAIIPGASHSVLKEQTKLCIAMIKRFLTQPLPPATKYPIRRVQRD
jgi:pimeloyl-ACP methyl ester carboxylesterase